LDIKIKFECKSKQAIVFKITRLNIIINVNHINYRFD